MTKSLVELNASCSTIEIKHQWGGYIIGNRTAKSKGTDQFSVKIKILQVDGVWDILNGWVKENITTKQLKN